MGGGVKEGKNKSKFSADVINDRPLKLLSSVQFRTKMVNSTVREFRHFPRLLTFRWILSTQRSLYLVLRIRICIEKENEKRRASWSTERELNELINIHWEADRPLYCVMCTHRASHSDSVNVNCESGTSEPRQTKLHIGRVVQCNSAPVSLTQNSAWTTTDYFLKTFLSR